MQAPGQPQQCASKQGQKLNWWGGLLLPLPPVVVSVFMVIAVAIGEILPQLNPYGWIIAMIMGLLWGGVTSVLVAITLDPRCGRLFMAVLVLEIILLCLAWSATGRYFASV